jgi:hypothetical protein
METNYEIAINASGLDHTPCIKESTADVTVGFADRTSEFTGAVALTILPLSSDGSMCLVGCRHLAGRIRRCVTERSAGETPAAPWSVTMKHR